MPTLRLRTLLIGVALASLSSCATVDRTEDLRIESEVKARLVAEKDANLTRLGVLSTNAVVYLSGQVPSPEQRDQAETVAKGVRGVRRVVNTLGVGPAPR
jgi:hyperosmotically inducible periplasmic protein